MLNIMKTLKYILIAIGLMGLSSCNESWLEPQPLSFYTPENVYNTPEGLESLLITIRKDMNLESHNMGEGLHNLIMEFAASDLGSPWSQLDFYKLTPNTDVYYNFLKMFTLIYGTIKNCNTLITHIDDIEWENEEARNTLLAQGLWYRAYWYYRLINSYGDVPFIGEEISGPKLDFYSHSRWAILNKIQADLEYAAAWLPVSA